MKLNMSAHKHVAKRIWNRFGNTTGVPQEVRWQNGKREGREPVLGCIKSKESVVGSHGHSESFLSARLMSLRLGRISDKDIVE